MCKDIIRELLMCKVFFLFIVWIFLCEPLCVQNSRHDFFGINTKWSFQKTTQSWWKQPYIQSGLRLSCIKKKVVEPCCRNCRFLGGGFGRYGLWLTIVISLSQGAHLFPTPNKGDFRYLKQVKISIPAWKSFGFIIIVQVAVDSKRLRKEYNKSELTAYWRIMIGPGGLLLVVLHYLFSVFHGWDSKKVNKQGVTNTLALPINKMSYIYLLCPHSEQQKNICSNLNSLNTFTKETGSSHVKSVLIR